MVQETANAVINNGSVILSGEHVGHALVNFFREADFVESKIGEISKSTSNNEEEPLIVSGLQLDEKLNPAHILSSLSVSLDSSPKFNKVLGKTSLGHLNDIISSEGFTGDDGSILIDRLKLFSSNKLLLMPFKPKTCCDVMVESAVRKAEAVATEVGAIKWINSMSSGKLECCIFTDVIDSNRNKRQKVNIEDYMSKFTISGISGNLHSQNVLRNAIKMSRYGYIHPIEFKIGEEDILAIDNVYIYLVCSGQIFIIGNWKGLEWVGGKLLEGVKAHKDFQKIASSVKFIGQHKRFIAPYQLVEANRVAI